MSYVYRITFPQEQEMVAYALTYPGVREIRNTAEKKAPYCLAQTEALSGACKRAPYC